MNKIPRVLGYLTIAGSLVVLVSVARVHTHLRSQIVEVRSSFSSQGTDAKTDLGDEGSDQLPFEGEMSSEGLGQSEGVNSEEAQVAGNSGGDSGGGAAKPVCADAFTVKGGEKRLYILIEKQDCSTQTLDAWVKGNGKNLAVNQLANKLGCTQAQADKEYLRCPLDGGDCEIDRTTKNILTMGNGVNNPWYVCAEPSYKFKKSNLCTAGYWCSGVCRISHACKPHVTVYAPPEPVPVKVKPPCGFRNFGDACSVQGHCGYDRDACVCKNNSCQKP